MLTKCASVNNRKEIEMSVELNDIRKKITLTTPKGATVVCWSDTLWATTSKLQAEATKSMVSNNGTGTVDTSAIDWDTKINEMIVDRIDSWNYVIDGVDLPISIDSLKKLPSEEVQYIYENAGVVPTQEKEQEKKDFLAQ